MRIVAKWDIAKCGFDQFHRECAAITRGCHDGTLQLRAVAPGKLALMEIEPKPVART